VWQHLAVGLVVVPLVVELAEAADPVTHKKQKTCNTPEITILKNTLLNIN
jgi:hypothetical protein